MIPPAGRTVGDLLQDATRRLRDANVPDPRRDAATLLAIALTTDRGGVLARKPDAVGDALRARFAELLSARERRIPLQHLAGVTEFHGLDFEVGPDVLIPRPETEDLVDAVLGAGLPADARVADLGTGSGCIAIALAVARPRWSVTAVDLSPSALAVARRNALRHRVSGRIDFVQRDFAEVHSNDRGRFDAVASNPPYIPEEEWRGLEPEVRDHEPRMALVPGPTGSEAYAAVAAAAAVLLRPGGSLTLELGWKSEAAVRRIVEAAGFGEISVRPDLQGIPRVLAAERR